MGTGLSKGFLLQQPITPPLNLKLVSRVFWVNPHATRDSFMLMRYASEDGKIQEWIWNSREGVTPFCVLSRKGTTMLQHVDWSHDIYHPKFVPPVGMRIFVNLTRERAREYAVEHVEKWRDEVEIAEGFKLWDDKEEAIEKFTERFYSEYGEGVTPDIIEVT